VNINHSTVLLRGVIRSQCICVSLCGKVCCLPLLTKSSRLMTCFLNDCWNLFFNLPITLVPAGPEGRGDPNDPCVRLKRDCVALLAAFRLIDVPSRIFILGNTQLYWDPEWPDVKLAQACYLLSWLVKFKESIQSKSDSPPLLVITGDYNSLPGDQVPRYHLPALQLDCKFLSVLFDNPHI
jgi:hypothetical protein